MTNISRSSNIQVRGNGIKTSDSTRSSAPRDASTRATRNQPRQEPRAAGAPGGNSVKVSGSSTVSAPEGSKVESKQSTTVNGKTTNVQQSYNSDKFEG
jgi:hypothetical protein